MKKRYILGLLLVIISILGFNFYRKITSAWQEVTPENLPLTRNENGFARVGEAFYLLGSRQIKPVERYDIKTRRWQTRSAPPLELHHFQAIVFKNEIYVVGAFTGNYPHETPVPRVYIYNPTQDAWRAGPDIPANRRRGSGGAILYQNKIYLVSGITDGHWDGHVTWFDEYDPATNKWRQLPEVPHARDHVQVAIVDNQLVVAGGRRTSARTKEVLDLMVGEVDIFDFKKNQWRTAPANQNIPTLRAGAAAVTLGNQVLIIGGESQQELAHNETEAFNVRTDTWQKLSPLQTGRHSMQALVYKNQVYIAAGTGKHGGSPELNSMEIMK